MKSSKEIKRTLPLKKIVKKTALTVSQKDLKIKKLNTEISSLNKKIDSLLKSHEDIRMHKEDNHELVKAVTLRTRQLRQNNIEFKVANKKLVFENKEKGKRAAELIIANKELAFQNNEKEKRASELIIANKELAFQNNEKEKRAVELDTANKDLTSFTYISSHDLQEPLRKIQNFTTCILNEEEKNLSDTGKDYFRRMMATAARMQDLIEDLLTYSRTKNGERIFIKTDLDLLVKEIEKDLENVMFQKQAVLEFDLDTIKVIPFQFRQLLHNLIGNSLKFSKADVAPHIILKSKIAKGNKLNNKYLLPKKEYCQVTLTDNGIGFDQQYNERIFEVFQRLHTTQQYHGTGIGLAICKRIVENHNGIITASGKLGEGARFDIYISAE